MTRRVRAAALAAAYALAWRLVRALPERLAARLFRAGADLAVRRGGKGVRRLRSNLARVAGAGADLDTLTRDAMRSYARYWLEVFRLQDWPAAQLVDRLDMPGEELLHRLQAEGRGVIVALPHSGNWDHAGAYIVVRGIPFTTVAERLEPASVFDRFVAFREQLGMEVLALTGAERPPFDVLADRLRAGRMVCLMADRDLTASGVDVEFFGATARMPAGPALLALRTGAALVPAHGRYVEGRSIVRIYDEIPQPAGGTEAERAAQMTQALADVFAEGIGAAPADWHMLQRLWLDDLDARDPRRGARAAA